MGSSAVALAQSADPVVKPGHKAVTSFAGGTIPFVETGFPPGVDPTDETFIDPDGATLRIFDVSDLGSGAAGQLVNTPRPFEVPARKIGQVFGLAFDDGRGTDGTTEGTANLYATATVLHGLQIVADDADGDRRPERLQRGQAGARFMEAQWGANDAGPGAIWKIDGRTGEATLFAKIDSNSGGALGNIAFDARNRQFFVSDLDTGLVHRLGMDGTVLDFFDHGVAGLVAAGVAPLPDDGTIMDIESPGFDAQNPLSWGLTPAERRVWGLGVHEDRLYYAVGDRAQIWSVGLARDGDFLDDAGLEFDVASANAHPVTDIAFDARGFLYLAQRGTLENAYDYSSFARSGDGEVMRYHLESPDDPATPTRWIPVPQTYATGFPDGHRQTAGGVDLQYGYREDGLIDRGRCEETLFKTGDGLRENAGLSDVLLPGGPLLVHGTQLTRKDLVRPENQPTFSSWHFDADGLFEQDVTRGHVGDVEVYRPCTPSLAAWVGPFAPGEAGPPPGGFKPKGYYLTRVPGGAPPTGSACMPIEDVYFSCTPSGELSADIYLGPTANSGALAGANTVKVTSSTPGISPWPGKQTRRSAGHPVSVLLGRPFPGSPMQLDLCLHDAGAAQPGQPFACCKASVTVPAPNFTCP